MHRSFLRARLVLVVAAAITAAITAAESARGAVPTGFTQETVTPGFTAPSAFDFFPNATETKWRALVVEQLSGAVKLVINGASAPTNPIATLPGVTFGSERGLLGVAIDPAFPARPYVYFHFTGSSPAGVKIARFRLAGDLGFTGNGQVTLDTATRFDLLSDVPDQAGNHNGGTVRFGTDGMLYASFGEDAVECAAQDMTTLRGVIVRLRVDALPDGPGAATRAQITPADNPFIADANVNKRLVWAFGLRNPFRFQLDTGSGALIVGDVGQQSFEELDIVDSGGGNFGWPLREGFATYHTCAGVSNPTLRAPVHAYDRSNFTASIMSAGAYRGVSGGTGTFPAGYEGDLFFADYYEGFLRRLEYNGSAWVIAAPVAGQPNASDWGTGFDAIPDWRVGPDGSLWYLSQGAGHLGRIRHENLPDTQAPTVSVSEPATGAVWRVGENRTVRWSASDDRGVTGVDIELARDGVTFAPVASALANSGAYDWTVTAPVGAGARFRVTARDAAGNSQAASSGAFDIVQPAISRIALATFPSPATREATLRVELPSPAAVSLSIYDGRGRLVRRLLDRAARPAGVGDFRWDGLDADGNQAPAGFYLARLETPAGTFTRRLPLLR